MEVEWLPFELYPGLPPEGAPLPEYLRSAGGGHRARLQDMAAQAGLPIIFHDRLINTRRALEAAEYARTQGKHAAFHRVVFRKFYGEGQDIHDWVVLTAAAEDSGVDPVEMRERVDAGGYSLLVSASMEEAVMKGIRGVPAYVFANRYLISGAQPYEMFRRVMQELGAVPRSDGHQR